MKLPSNENLAGWANELVKHCNGSVPKRISDAMLWRSLYLDGAEPGGQAIYNKTYAHIDALSSALYSPAELRFLIELPGYQDQNAFARAEEGSAQLTRKFKDDGVAMTFANTVPWGLVYGKAFVKVGWFNGHFKSWSVMPYEIGVYRDDYPSLADQECFVQTYYTSVHQLRRTLSGHPKEKDIIRQVEASMADASGFQGEGWHKLYLQGTQPIITNGAQPKPAGFAQIRPNSPTANVSPMAARETVKMHELWVWDDDKDDWTTIKLVADGPVIEGEIQRRNLFAKGLQPLSEVCPNPSQENFWGNSECNQTRHIQVAMNHRITDIMRLLDKQVSRKLAFLGANGVASEQMAAYQSGDGWFSHADMNAKIQDITPPMPPEVFAEVHEFERMFDEMSGITPTLAGRGDAGVRSADHAETLVRMSSPRLRDRALLIEHQVAELGDLCFQLMQEKDGRQYTASDGTEFYLNTLPEDYSVTVDAHSASPVFVDDAMRHAMILKQQGAIDEEDLLLLTSPPMLPTLLKKLRERKAAQAEFAKEHPEIVAKQMQHRKK